MLGYLQHCAPKAAYAVQGFWGLGDYGDYLASRLCSTESSSAVRGTRQLEQTIYIWLALGSMYLYSNYLLAPKYLYKDYLKANVFHDTI